MELRDLLGLLIVGAFVMVVGLLFFIVIPQENKDVVNFALGQLSGFVGGVIAFHYTASQSDTVKTENTGKAFEAITATAHAAQTASAAPVVAAVEEGTAGAKENTKEIVAAVEKEAKP